MVQELPAFNNTYHYWYLRVWIKCSTQHFLGEVAIFYFVSNQGFHSFLSISSRVKDKQNKQVYNLQKMTQNNRAQFNTYILHWHAKWLM